MTVARSCNIVYYVAVRGLSSNLVPSPSTEFHFPYFQARGVNYYNAYKLYFIFYTHEFILYSMIHEYI